MIATSIEEFFGTLQGSMVKTWKYHLATNKYSEHVALNEFYDGVIDLVDTLIENYIGVYGKVDSFVNLMQDGLDALTYLEELRELCLDGRGKLIAAPELQADMDPILSLIDSTMYKLRELSEHHTMVTLRDYVFENLFEN